MIRPAFGIRVSSGSRPDSPRVEVFIAQETLSVDDEPYILECITSFSRLSSRLTTKSDALRYRELLGALGSVTEVHSLIWSGFHGGDLQTEDLWAVHSFEWGVRHVGDPVVLFVPYRELTHLTFHWPSNHCHFWCEVHRDLTGRVSGLQISAPEIVATLDDAVRTLKQVWNAAKPDFAFRVS